MGDYGGPLYKLNEDGTPDCLYGVASHEVFWEEPPCQVHIFAKILEVNKWVESQIDAMKCNESNPINN